MNQMEQSPEPSKTLLLMVEDGNEVLRSVSARLHEAGYRVATTPSRPIAFEFLKDHSAELVVLHADWFYLEGGEVQERFRNLCPGSRVIFLDVDGDYFLFLEHTAASLLIYPFRSECLLEAIAEILRASPEGSHLQAVPLEAIP